MGMMLVLLMLSGFFGEYMRIQSIVDRVETQLTQATNVSIETAMWDSVRIDGGGELDQPLARNTFENYLTGVMGLNSRTLFNANGDMVYRLDGMSVNITVLPPAMEVTCTLNIPGMYTFLPGMQLPIRAGSRNARAD